MLDCSLIMVRSHTRQRLGPEKRSVYTASTAQGPAQQLSTLTAIYTSELQLLFKTY